MFTALRARLQPGGRPAARRRRRCGFWPGPSGRCLPALARRRGAGRGRGARGGALVGNGRLGAARADGARWRASRPAVAASSRRASPAAEVGDTHAAAGRCPPSRPARPSRRASASSAWRWSRDTIAELARLPRRGRRRIPTPGATGLSRPHRPRRDDHLRRKLRAHQPRHALLRRGPPRDACTRPRRGLRASACPCGRASSPRRRAAGRAGWRMRPSPTASGSTTRRAMARSLASGRETLFHLACAVGLPHRRGDAADHARLARSRPAWGSRRSWPRRTSAMRASPSTG